MSREKLKNIFHNIFIGGSSPSDSYYLMRRIFSAGLGFIYFNAFLIYYNQGLGLYGERGVLPYKNLIPIVKERFPDTLDAFKNFLTIFLFSSSDVTIKAVGIFGILFSLLLVFGYVNFFILLILWFLHFSIVQAGQIFYSYGWETQLLELTFLSFYLFPLINPKLNRAETPPKKISIIFMRWMMFRLMLGAGLIKLRGDECWSNLTCTEFHYETQPNPNPLSWLFHHLPNYWHYGEVLFNHFVEILLPFALFGPKWVRRACGIIMIVFQVSLIISGNLSWLNWITILMAIPCFDDEFLSKIFKLKKYFTISQLKPKKLTCVVLFLFFLFGTYLSINPALNLLSEKQAMNTSYDRFHFINSYGAFGYIGKTRGEVIISGTTDKNVTQDTIWKEYEFNCKPGDLNKTPCLISPYHYRLDWQIWFSGMRSELSEYWLLSLITGFLENNENILSLIRENPFKETPPTFIKMDLYHYQFTDFGEKGWWKREYLKPYSEVLSLEHPLVKQVRRHGDFN